MKYIVVLHNWFMGSKGFDIKELDVDTYDDALNVAREMYHEKSSTFNKCEFTVLTIQKNESLVTRKLTWKERLTGKLLNE